jgi:RNA polymerase sigma factor (sigma-70 family)
VAVPVETHSSEHIGSIGERDMQNSVPGWTDEIFQNFFMQNFARLAGVVFRFVGDYSRAEDLTIEAFWRLYRQPFGESTRFNPSGWIYRTATRMAIDSLRADARRGRIEQEAGPMLAGNSAPDPLGGVLEAERRAQVRKALAYLRPEQAQLLILRASGFSYQELADTLGVKRASVGTRLIRAEAAFRKSFLGLHGK